MRKPGGTSSSIGVGPNSEPTWRGIPSFFIVIRFVVLNKYYLNYVSQDAALRLNGKSGICHSVGQLRTPTLGCMLPFLTNRFFLNPKKLSFPHFFSFVLFTDLPTQPPSQAPQDLPLPIHYPPMLSQWQE